MCYDPFYQDMPKYFQISFKEVRLHISACSWRSAFLAALGEARPCCLLALQLLESKHPTAWVEFECSRITEDELFAKVQL